MRFISCDQLVDDYLFMKTIINELGDQYFELMTPGEIEKEKQSFRSELKKDCSFKLLTMIEADLRKDFNVRVAKRRGDYLSSEYLHICKQIVSNGGYYRPIQGVLKEIRIDDILVRIRDYLKGNGNALHSSVSNLKGYFKFRHWYAHGRYIHNWKHYHRDECVPDPMILRDIHNDLCVTLYCRG